MRVLLILPKINSDSQWNVGLAYISSVLKDAGHEVELFEFEKYPKDLDELFSKIKEFNPGIVGFGSNSHQFYYVKKIAEDIKEKFGVLIFVGGVHTVLNPEAISENEAIDGVCVGEGEFSFLELVNKIDPAERGRQNENYLDTKNFWFRSRNKIIKNEKGLLVEDLNSLPFPDRSIFSYFKKDFKKTPRFIFSRGCPFDCTYCCNHALKRAFEGKGPYMRWRSVDKALEEIVVEKEKYDFNYFKLDDDTFSLNKPWMKEFCEKLAQKNWGVSFECNIRPGTINEEGMALLKKAGCKMIKVGIESGDSTLRKTIMNRLFSNEDIKRIFDLAKKFDIKTFSFNIVGVPGETKETIKTTIELNREIKPDFMQITAYYPYKTTSLGEICFKKGYVEKTNEDSYMEKSVLRLPTISKREIERAVKNFKFNVYISYDKKKALKEKLNQFKKFIIKNPIIYPVAKFFYQPIKFIKKRV